MENENNLPRRRELSVVKIFLSMSKRVPAGRTSIKLLSTVIGLIRWQAGTESSPIRVAVCAAIASATSALPRIVCMKSCTVPLYM